MEPGHQTTPTPHSFTPSITLLAWALIAGTALVINAAGDEKPPQPSAAQAFPAAVPPAPSGSFLAALPNVQPLPNVRPLLTAKPLPNVRPLLTAKPLPTVKPLPPSDPVRLRVPAIDVDAPMTRLGLDAAGALRPPPADSPGLAGWYGDGTAPGSTGTAVTTGHVDTRAGPAVFHDLGALTKGDTIEISRADQRTAVFTVDALEVYEKKKFPDKKVYGSSGRPELRLITCGGEYTKSTGYQGNLVVYATLTAVK
ncbi:sortase family protein [Streptomyces sp. SLBN-118]|uniref:class F sortase n=1 Tax=Streptomyces sp. SLBN-118 TaxID=2768454 RepID=UPI001153AF9E|nr:class F sortase [Streptomyces sp. SLBN-118]TQK52941.1 sortase family protein [Streptomyces sp. SLBN-118]